ncbi:F-box/LRR-repeat protein 7-like isoform X2 [Schistocerca nitens]|uniref:F-box/LRR-repeat protein 7-like isoform X2 n=1 Tax=Schistocerca nitens TaxID=7011 RepID=UPI00211826F2|nr:F-box/LRR-repeat protein 7-like isoform X2 [Schistocerca nitens]
MELEVKMEDLVVAMAAAMFPHSPVTSESGEDASNGHAERPIRKIFVGNISPGTTRAELKECFDSYGVVLDAVVIVDKNACKRKYYGFVTFLVPAQACSAMMKSKTLHGITLNGKRLYVAPADSWHQPYQAADGTLVLDPWRGSQSASAGGTKKVAPILQQDTDVEESLCMVNILNDDCLMHVFSYLSCYERIAIERVCKRWQSISQMMWKSTRELCAKKLRNIHKSLPAIIQRCGSSLKKLDLSHDTQTISRETVVCVGRYCRELEELRITHSRLNGSTLRPLNGPQLRVLDLTGCCGISDRDLSHLLVKCPVLERLSVAGWFRLSGWGLGRVSNSLRHLTLDGCTGLDGKQVARAVKTITKLDLSANCSLGDIDVKHILDSAKNLEELTMAQLFPLLNGRAFSAIAAKGEQLTLLDLKFNASLTDDLLISIVNSCINMKELNVEGCCALNNIALIMECLSALKNLEILIMSYLPGKSDSCMLQFREEGFPALKKLEMRGSPYLGDIGTACILSLCYKLECLDISGCQCVTTKGLSCALAQRKSSVPLQIIVGGTSVSEGSLQPPSSVALSFHNNCTDHLRPDFVDDYLLPMFEDYSDDDFIDSDNEYDFGSGIDEYDSDMSDSYDAFEDNNLYPELFGDTFLLYHYLY